MATTRATQIITGLKSVKVGSGPALKAPNKADDPAKFIIRIKIPDIDPQPEEGYFEDVQQFTARREAITNLASYELITFNLQNSQFIQIQQKIRENKFPKAEVKILQVDPKEEQNGKPYKIVKETTTKQYIIIETSSEETSKTTYHGTDMKASYIAVTCTLINPSLYDMAKQNGYNKKVDKKTANEMRKDYQDHLKSTYNISEFVEINNNNDDDKFKYEQQIMRSENDLTMASHIMQNMKPSFTWGFMFFDDFVIKEGEDSDVVTYYINLGDKKQFKKVDFFSKSNEVAASIATNTTPISDPNPLGATNQTLTYTTRGNNEVLEIKQAEKTPNVPSASGQDGMFSYTDKEQKVARSTQIIGNDNETSQKRYEKTQEQFKDYLESIDSYDINEGSMPDFYQFGNIYNLNPSAKSDYSFTPIQIVNNFVRDSGKVPILIHTAKVNFVKFKSDDLKGNSKGPASNISKGALGNAALSMSPTPLNVSRFNNNVVGQMLSKGKILDGSFFSGLNSVVKTAKNVVSTVSNVTNAIVSTKNAITGTVSKINSLTNARSTIARTDNLSKAQLELNTFAIQNQRNKLAQEEKEKADLEAQRDTKTTEFKALYNVKFDRDNMDLQ